MNIQNTKGQSQLLLYRNLIPFEFLVLPAHHSNNNCQGCRYSLRIVLSSGIFSSLFDLGSQGGIRMEAIQIGNHNLLF